MPESRTFLPYGRQQIDQNDIDAVVKVLKGDWLTTGPAVKTFEDELARVCQSTYAISVCNGTAALHIAYLALGLGPGDAILTTPITFVATANAARLVGADVVFADVRQSDICLDPEAVEKALAMDVDRKIKIVVPVHFGGKPCDMKRIKEIADRYDVRVVEDACHALGATYTDTAGSPVGCNKYADATVFSFHPVKNITTGEGGAVTTNQPEIAAAMSRLRSHGIERDPERWQNKSAGMTDGDANPWYYEMQALGLNYRLTDIQAALGTSQLQKLAPFIKRRRAIASQYCRELADLAPVVQPLLPDADQDSAWHLFVILVDFVAAGISRNAFVAKLRSANIGSQVHYIPVTHQPYYRARYPSTAYTLPRAENYYKQCVSLPMYPGLTEKDIKYIAKQISGILASS